MGKTNNSTVPAFGMKDRLGYMFGDFGNDFTFILSSMFMMKFYTDVMGLSAGVVGMLMMAARFVDAFTDVTMGQIVDRSKPTKDGKFRPWIKMYVRACGNCQFPDLSVRTCRYAVWSESSLHGCDIFVMGIYFLYFH